jgi:hypothetical protein
VSCIHPQGLSKESRIEQAGIGQNNPVYTVLPEEFMHDPGIFHARESLVQALKGKGKAAVINAQAVQDGRIQVIQVNR